MARRMAAGLGPVILGREAALRGDVLRPDWCWITHPDIDPEFLNSATRPGDELILEPGSGMIALGIEPQTGWIQDPIETLTKGLALNAALASGSVPGGPQRIEPKKADLRFHRWKT